MIDYSNLVDEEYKSVTNQTKFNSNQDEYEFEEQKSRGNLIDDLVKDVSETEDIQKMSKQ
jgi:hypothetical protein